MIFWLLHSMIDRSRWFLKLHDLLSLVRRGGLLYQIVPVATSKQKLEI